MLLGVDVGGTFTDAVLMDGARIVTAKAPTSPDDQSAGVLAAVDAVLAAAGRTAAGVTGFAHGMTVATNALLEGRGARTAFLATDGFTDLVELGRQARPELYRLCASHPAPFTPPERRIAVPERMGARGEELRALDPAAAAAVADAVAACGAEAVAVCLLHADRHPAHERALGAVLRERLGPGVHVSLSHDVVGTFREAERATTTELDAALSPLLGAYLRRLAGRATEADLPEPRIMQSSGGLTGLEQAAAHAATCVLSGPAGGAAAAALIAAACDEPDLVCLDMGGTSCDVSVVEGGQVRETAGREVGGRAVALPMVDVHTVGAGGGSVAWRDAGGALRVGPRSAGAQPGPAAYGRGGTEPTVTDAHVVLGHLDPAEPLAGGVALDAPAAHAAVAGLAGELGLEVHETARGIVRVADAEMARALRVMTVERGVDPRAFALLAFGGAGGLHAAALAGELGMTRVLVPRAGGVLSALGLAAAPRRRDEAQTVLLAGGELTAADLDELRAGADAVAWDVRYRGQAHELTLRDVAPDPRALEDGLTALHRERYGWADPGAPWELVTVRRTWREEGPPVALAGPDEARAAPSQAHGEPPADPRTRGPAVLRLPETTVLVPEGWTARTDPTGTVRLERAA
jgi:N-methylhydantoinase A/oxoprolinase/acetone carboxylase beta subunit